MSDVVERINDYLSQHWVDDTGQKLTIHSESLYCLTRCCIHNPSDHPMRDFPRHWRGDKGIMERICPHGVGHPDPDDLAFKLYMRGPRVWHHSVHGCDGCCKGSYDDLREAYPPDEDYYAEVS